MCHAPDVITGDFCVNEENEWETRACLSLHSINELIYKSSRVRARWNTSKRMEREREREVKNPVLRATSRCIRDSSFASVIPRSIRKYLPSQFVMRVFFLDQLEMQTRDSVLIFHCLSNILSLSLYHWSISPVIRLKTRSSTLAVMFEQRMRIQKKRTFLLWGRLDFWHVHFLMIFCLFLIEDLYVSWSAISILL